MGAMALRPGDPRLTANEWGELEDPPGHRFAIIRGELDVTPGATPEHGQALGELYVALRRSLPAGLRIVIGVDWHLESAAKVTAAPRPDLMVIPIDGPVVPLLVIEVLSPSDHHRFRGLDLSRIEAKRLDYAEAGLQHYVEVDLLESPALVSRYELRNGRLVATDEAIGTETLASELPFPYEIRPADLESPE